MMSLSLRADISRIRLDKFLSEEIEYLSRTKIQEIIKSAGVLVDGHPVKPSYLLEGGELIKVEIPEVKLWEDVVPKNIPLEVLYEDESLIALNKPPRLPTHPGAGNFEMSLVNGLLYHFKQLSDVSGFERPGIVHRLDQDTSGVLLIAKNNESHVRLARQFAERSIEKTYIALVWGLWDSKKGTIDSPIGRHPRNRKKFTTALSGRTAVTSYQLEKTYSAGSFKDHLSLVKVFPKTGRTHQIRVHFSSIRHPIFADELYGGGISRIKGFTPNERKKISALFSLISRQALHALEISFDHPKSGKRMTITAPLAKDFKAVLECLETYL